MPGNTDPVVGQFPETLLVAVAKYRINRIIGWGHFRKLS
jgi:hypothetical protein